MRAYRKLENPVSPSKSSQLVRKTRQKFLKSLNQLMSSVVGESVRQFVFLLNDSYGDDRERSSEQSDILHLFENAWFEFKALHSGHPNKCHKERSHL